MGSGAMPRGFGAARTEGRAAVRVRDVRCAPAGPAERPAGFSSRGCVCGIGGCGAARVRGTTQTWGHPGPPMGSGRSELPPRNAQPLQRCCLRRATPPLTSVSPPPRALSPGPTAPQSPPIAIKAGSVPLPHNGPILTPVPGSGPADAAPWGRSPVCPPPAPSHRVTSDGDRRIPPSCCSSTALVFEF